ncbi:MAG: GNAT family N-acetyltransferase [Gammaproteobacteria bacterium]|nr:MAG: GNAT family N-acetyltransferase [Gammaproteobacteria bacterium]
MAWLSEFVELNKKLHDRESFACTKEPLNLFLKTQASKHAQDKVSKTYVLLGTETLENGKSPICAFYTVSPSSIERKTLPEKISKRLPRYPIPVILIGQLAVNACYIGSGLGQITLIKALKFALSISDDLGGFAVIVDCLDDDAESFYLKFGFEELVRTNGKMRMFLPMKTIAQLP